MLLRRNYYQIKNVDLLLAIGSINFNNNTVNGGTGWAVEMAKNMNNINIFVFDQSIKKQYNYNRNNIIFEESETPKIITSFAGIGTREISNEGCEAIKNVFKISNLKH